VQDSKEWGVTDELYQSAISTEEVAALVSYLTSKDAKHITGKSLHKHVVRLIGHKSGLSRTKCKSHNERISSSCLTSYLGR
jgi:hypothetical protein